LTPSLIALSVIAGIVVVASVVGFYAGTRHRMDL